MQITRNEKGNFEYMRKMNEGQSEIDR